jgi:IS4 transposase
MSHQDKVVGRVRYNAEFLQQAIRWLLKPVDWSGIQFRDDCTWQPLHLAAAVLVWAWSDETTLGDRFFAARRIIAHLYRPQQEFAGSVQAFMKMLVKWTVPLLAVVQAALQRRMQQALANRWLVYGFVVFAADGSREDLPRTRSHEAAYSPDTPQNPKKRDRRKKTRTKANDKKAKTPLMWLTLLWHVGSGLPWCWRCGPSGSSEREHCREMLVELPEHALLTADAGFTGYDFLAAILDSGRHVLVRVGSNVRLLRKLGCVRESSQTVYLWPDHAAKKNQPPIVLRLVVVQGPRHPIYLVTNLSAQRLPDRAVKEIYRRRWGIELFFRHFKQTFQRRKLRSTKAEHARVELEWSLLALWGMACYAQVEMQQQGVDPDGLSMAGVLRAFRRMLRDYLHPIQRGCSLARLLARAVRDTYQRKNKKSRNYPRQKHPDPPAGSPQIFKATSTQVRRAQKLKTA